MAAVCWALTRWVAILRRSIDILRRVVRPSGPGRPEALNRGGCGGKFRSRGGRRMSQGSTGRRSHGAARVPWGRAGGRGGSFRHGCRTPGPSRPGSMRAMTVPMATSSPSARGCGARPTRGFEFVGDLVGFQTTSISPLATESPSFLRQEATLAEVMDSPEAGTLISTTGRSGRGRAGRGGLRWRVARRWEPVGATGLQARWDAGGIPDARRSRCRWRLPRPSPTRISGMPSAAASSSLETLSVSRVTSTSPLRTESPFFLCQRATLAEVTDSPEAGTLTSVVMKNWKWRMI
jgi:hypothetical protein